MTTTLEIFAKAKQRNYCVLPTVDVEILPFEWRCSQCDQLVVARKYDGWFHADRSVPCHEEPVMPKVMCRYCHSQDAVNRQRGRIYAVECGRCGGVDGYAR